MLNFQIVKIAIIFRKNISKKIEIENDFIYFTG
jgi:hypothetical protein